MIMSKYIIKRVLLIICIIAVCVGAIKIKIKLENPSIILDCDIPEDKIANLMADLESYIEKPCGKWTLSIKVIGYENEHIEFVVYKLFHPPIYQSTYTYDFWKCIEVIRSIESKFIKGFH